MKKQDTKKTEKKISSGVLSTQKKTKHPLNHPSQPEKAILLYQRLTHNSIFTAEDQLILGNLKKALEPPKGALCFESDFLYTDPYCKNCDRYAHCLLRAIDKIKNTNYSV